jgi:hypothetical protein
MAESNLRALLATAKGAGREPRDSAIPDSEMEAILGVLKGNEDGVDDGGADEPHGVSEGGQAEA